MRRSVARHVLSPLALIVCMASAAAAQARAPGRLTGTVTDGSGAVIPGAGILAKNSQTGAEFREFTNAVGVWLLPSVPSGRYTVTVSLHGFTDVEVKDITVAPGETKTVDVTLQIGLREEVMVTASKYEQEVVNAPATATVIAERTILNSPSPNLGELLRSVPGMNVVQTSAREFNITSRAAAGLFSGSQLALIDGRTIYHDDVGYLCWDGQATNLNQIKQVEVIRGPASAIWGANAMNGIINIITKPPREMLGTTLTLGIGTFDRSGGGAESDRGSLYYFNASHAQALNDRWAYKITAGAFTQDAFGRPQGNIPNAFQTPYPPFSNEGTTQPMVDARVDYDLPAGQHFTFAGGYGGTSGIMHSQLGPLDVHRFYMKSYGKVEYVRGSLRINGYVNLSGGATTNLLLVDTSGQPILTNDNNQTYHVEFSDGRVFQSRHVISYGANFRHNEFDLSLAPEGKRRDEGGVYLQDEILLSDHFRWVIGTRIDKFDSIEGIVVSPRTTFMMKVAPGQTLRVSYNRAYMAPSMIMNYLYNPFMTPLDLGMIDPDLAGTYYSLPVLGLGNRDLEEQSLNAYEIGYSAIVKGRANLGAAFYVNDIKNSFATVAAETYSSQNPPPGWPLPPYVLDLLGLPSTFQYQNLGKVRNKGIELNIDARFNRSLGGFANYSWQARPEPQGFDISLLNLPPAHRFNAGLDFDYGRYLGSISVGYVGSAYWTDVIGPPYSGPTDAYTAVNLSAGVRFGRGKYLAMLKVANLANTPIQNHVFGDILRRQVTGELRMQF